MTTMQQCVNRLVKDHGFSQAEAEKLALDVAREKLALEESGGTFKASDAVVAMEKSFDADRLANQRARRNTANAIRIYKEITDGWNALRETDENVKAGKVDFVDYLTGYLVGEGARFTGVRRSVAALSEGLYKSRRGALDNILESLGQKYGQDTNFIYKVLSDPRDNANQLDYLAETYRPGSTQNVMMAETAQAIQALFEELRVRGNAAGGDTAKLPYGYHPAAHSTAKLTKSGVNEWKRVIIPLLDWEQTMPDFYAREQAINNSSLAPQEKANALAELLSEREGVLEDVYRNIILGRDLQMQNIEYPLPRTVGNSRHRLLHFKDGDSFYAYHNKFGEGSILHGIDQHIRGSTNRITLMERLGTKPQDMISRLVKGELDRLHATQGTDAVRQIKRLQGAYDTSFRQNPSGFIANQMKELMGETRSPVNISAARVGVIARALQAGSKLGLAALSTITDINTTVGRQHAWGSDLSASLVEAPAYYVRRFRGDKQALLRELGVVNNAMWGSLASRFEISNAEPGTIAKMTNLFYRYSGLTFMTEAMQSGHAIFLSRLAGRSKNLDWNALDPDFRRGLEYHGFDAGQWSLMRNMMEDVDGESYLSPSRAQSLTEAQLEPFLPDSLRVHKKGRSKATFAAERAQALYRLRNRIEANVLGMFSDDVKFAAMEPDARSRVTLQQGTRPGTLVGELLRGVGQFKSWPIMMWQRQVAGAGWKRNSVQGWDAPGMIQFMLIGLASGYLAVSLKDLAKGRTPRDIAKWETLLSASWQSGFFGLYGDFIFGPQFGGDGALANAVLGPTGGMLNDLSDIPGKLVRGDAAGAGRDAARVGMQNIPLANHWAFKGAVDYFILDEMKELLSPGWKRRMRKNMEKTGQRPLFQ